MSISNYPSGFRGGALLKNVPLFDTIAGNVFWVDSGTGGAGNPGTFNRPLDSVENAFSKCTANNGDYILVKPGHTETVTAAAGLVMDVAGVTVIGYGTGSDRPTVNFTTAVGADMDIDAANITIQNFLFTGGVDALTGPIDVNAADFTMIGCETRDVTGQATDFIVTDANADRMFIYDWVHRGASAAGADTAISIVGGDNITIVPRFIDGNFAVAAIENVTTAAVNLRVYGAPEMGTYIRTRNAADVIFTAVAATTGAVGPYINARLQDDAANITEAFVGAAMEFFNPIRIVNADAETDIEYNATASTDAIV